MWGGAGANEQEKQENCKVVSPYVIMCIYGNCAVSANACDRMGKLFRDVASD